MMQLDLMAAPTARADSTRKPAAMQRSPQAHAAYMAAKARLHIGGRGH
jgi:hypothetical protein